MTVWLFPATVITSDLVLGPVLAVTVYITVPLPLPLLPEVIVIQLTISEALQPQPIGDVTLILPVPPSARNDLLVGNMEYIQEFTIVTLYLSSLPP